METDPHRCQVDEEWPLDIMDHQGAEHQVHPDSITVRTMTQVYLKPGEMLWYESARLVHGRQRPFKGAFFDNLFLHYKPAGLW